MHECGGEWKCIHAGYKRERQTETETERDGETSARNLSPLGLQAKVVTGETREQGVAIQDFTFFNT